MTIEPSWSTTSHSPFASCSSSPAICWKFYTPGHCMPRWLVIWVCSGVLGGANVELPDPGKGYGVGAPAVAAVDIVDVDVDGCWFVAHVANDGGQGRQEEIGRASCRERV